MRIIARSTLREYWQKHPDTEQPLKAWFDIMNLKPIRTAADYQQALKEIEQIFEAESNTPEYEKLDILTTLVEFYEQQNYPIEPPSPIAAILYYLESRNQGISTFIENLKHHGVSEEIINTALNEMIHG